MTQALTVVILSYERQSQLRRQLLYFANKPVHLVLADGSEHAWLLGMNGRIGEMTWEYQHVPGYDTFTQRLRVCLPLVNTEFMCFLDDEECLLWTGLTQAMGHLSNHNEQSCAGGHVVHTVPASGGLCLAPWGRWSEKWSLLDDSPLQRFREMVSRERTANLYYQVTRTADVRIFVEGLENGTFAYRGCMEVLLSGFLALTGKWEMGTYPFWIRNGGSVSPPPSVTSFMSPSDVQAVSKRLMSTSSTWRLSRTLGAGDYGLADLEQLIDGLWGATGQSDNRGVSSTLLAKGVMKIRARFGVSYPSPVGKFLATIRSLRHRVRVGFRPEPPESGCFTFLEYAASCALSPDSQADLLHIAAIWDKYPDGVSAELWGSLGVDGWELQER